MGNAITIQFRQNPSTHSFARKDAHGPADDRVANNFTPWRGIGRRRTELVLQPQIYLRKMRTELYPHVEKMVRAFEIRSLLPEGKGWIVDGRKYRPGPSDDEFREAR